MRNTQGQDSPDLDYLMVFNKQVASLALVRFYDLRRCYEQSLFVVSCSFFLVKFLDSKHNKRINLKSWVPSKLGEFENVVVCQRVYILLPFGRC